MRRLLGVAGALALALAVSVVWVAPAAAGGGAGSEGCSTVVLDEAGLLGDERSVVETAARALGQLGAEVRVRALERVAGGDIDGWMRAEERRCPGWLGVGGLRRANLLVVAVATEDRKTGLWYGEQWRSALDGRWQALQVDFMNPLFKQGEFGAGLAAGLGAMAGEIASPATSGGPLRGTTTTVFRDAVRRPDYVAEPEYGEPYDEPGGGGGGGSGVPAGFVAIMVVMGVLGLGSAVLRAGGSNASGSRWWGGGGSNDVFGMHGMHGSGGDSHSSPSSSGGGDFSGGGGGGSGSSGGGGGGGGSTSW